MVAIETHFSSGDLLDARVAFHCAVTFRFGGFPICYKLFSYFEPAATATPERTYIENKTKLLENYIDFWKLLPQYYQSLYTNLLNKGFGYQGLIYREAVNNLVHFSNSLKEEQYIFAGFNALNAAEEKIITHLIGVKVYIFLYIN